MKRFDIDEPGLKQAFEKAYKEKEQQALPEMAEMSGTWEADVMRRIRSLEPANSGGGLKAMFEQVAWRLAPVACGLIIVLATWLVQFGSSAEYDLAALDVEDPIGFSVILPLDL